MKRLGVFFATPPGLDASQSQVTSQHFVRFPQQFAGTHLYSWVERGTVRVKCLAQEHNTMTRPGLEPGPLNPESSALTTRPPRLPQYDYGKKIIFIIRPKHCMIAVKQIYANVFHVGIACCPSVTR